MNPATAVLPQRASHARGTVDGLDWLYEPYWPGERLMARLADGRVTLTDEHGEGANARFPEAAEVLAALIDADSAVIDGVWTLHREERGAFVAVDLVELDGQPLQEIPFAERRRLLESVVEQTGRVRVSPSVRAPVGGWVDAWRTDGFAYYVAKRANSRYRPGERVTDWLVLSLGKAPPIVA